MDLRQALMDETVATVGYRELVSIDKGSTVREAVAVMQEHKVGCIVVTEKGRIAGILTERDVVVRVLNEGVDLGAPLAAHMTPDPVVAKVDEPIHQVLARMHKGGLRHLPVVGEQNEPLGTVSVKRAVHFLGAHMPEAIFNLPPEPDAYPATREGA